MTDDSCNQELVGRLKNQFLGFTKPHDKPEEDKQKESKKKKRKDKNIRMKKKNLIKIKN